MLQELLIINVCAVFVALAYSIRYAVLAGHERRRGAPRRAPLFLCLWVICLLVQCRLFKHLIVLILRTN